MKTSREKKTPIQALAALHESASLRAVTGPSLRPGGFLLTERGLSLCGFSPGARIVDVGCGTGASVAYLQEKHRHRALGVDVSGDLLPKNDRKGNITAVVARAEELPLSTGSCDGVLCECVLSLVTEPGRAVEEFSRVLRPGGFLILSDMYDRSADTVVPSVSASSGQCVSVLRTRPIIEMILGNAGFRPPVWEDHTRHLKELAAQLILSSDSITEFRDLFRGIYSACVGPSGFRNVRPGYYLLVAQKMTKGETCHGRSDVPSDGAETQGILL